MTIAAMSGALIIFGLYFMHKGVDENFNKLKMFLGGAIFFSGMMILVIGIIHGELVPSFLAVSASVLFVGVVT